jgi:OOP family OmpA-OmpF porin
MPGQPDGCGWGNPFLIFFDHHTDKLSNDAVQRLENVASVWKSISPKLTVEIIGYTDTSFQSAAESLNLSEQIAENVADALVKLGVDKDILLVSWRGAEDNRIPTKPGVSEPQNRRVEIWLK